MKGKEKKKKTRKLTEHFPPKGHKFVRKEIKRGRKIDREVKIAGHVYKTICDSE